MRRLMFMDRDLTAIRMHQGCTIVPHPRCKGPHRLPVLCVTSPHESAREHARLLTHRHVISPDGRMPAMRSGLWPTPNTDMGGEFTKPTSLIETCEADRLVVSCGSRSPLQQESRRCAFFIISSIGWAIPEPDCRSLLLYRGCG